MDMHAQLQELNCYSIRTSRY